MKFNEQEKELEYNKSSISFEVNMFKFLTMISIFYFGKCVYSLFMPDCDPFANTILIILVGLFLAVSIFDVCELG